MGDGGSEVIQSSGTDFTTQLPAAFDDGFLGTWGALSNETGTPGAARMGRSGAVPK
jgi:hypothetical protein